MSMLSTNETVTIARRDDILGTVARQINEEQLIFLFFLFCFLFYRAKHSSIEELERTTAN